MLSHEVAHLSIGLVFECDAQPLNCVTVRVWKGGEAGHDLVLFLVDLGESALLVHLAQVKHQLLLLGLQTFSLDLADFAQLEIGLLIFGAVFKHLGLLLLVQFDFFAARCFQVILKHHHIVVGLFGSKHVATAFVLAPKKFLKSLAAYKRVVAELVR